MSCYNYFSALSFSSNGMHMKLSYRHSPSIHPSNPNLNLPNPPNIFESIPINHPINLLIPNDLPRLIILSSPPHLHASTRRLEPKDPLGFEPLELPVQLLPSSLDPTNLLRPTVTIGLGFLPVDPELGVVVVVVVVVVPSTS